MEEKDKIIVKLAQEDVETSNNLLNNNRPYTHSRRCAAPWPAVVKEVRTVHQDREHGEN